MPTMKKSLSFILVSVILFLITMMVNGCSEIYDGEELFFRVGCSQCHTFNGRGGRMAPDLSAVTIIRSDKWIDSYLQNPLKINPLSRMPSFAHLSKAKRKAIIKFLNE
jgi:cbb3-type cytochrome oxidase cytochrome c subunit